MKASELRAGRMRIREPKPIGDGICEVELTKGQVAIIDECDAEKVSLSTWHAHPVDVGFYARSRPDWLGRCVYMHRLILCFPHYEIDHINRNKLDNRRRNLRVSLAGENQRNKASYSGCSRFKGVHESSRGRWTSQITVKKKTFTLGVFDTETDAAAAYDHAARLLHKDFAYQNGCEPSAEIIHCVEMVLEAERKPRIAWTAEQLEFVQRNRHIMTAEQIASYIGRTCKSVQHKLSKCR